MDHETLIQAAKLLYGDHWSGTLSHELGVNRRTLQAIAEGRYKLKKDHPMIRETLELLRIRHQEITRFLTRLKPQKRAA